MNPPNNKRKKSIEIYFVLYLAALILLLPGKDDKNHQFGESAKLDFQLPFSLQPEKTNLICRIAFDSAGPRIIYLDSINTILYKGDVENLKFDFVIEDEQLKQKLPISPDSTPVSGFRVRELSGQKAAVFIWKPSATEIINKSYLVRVNATGINKNPQLGNSGKNEEFIKVSTQFSLTVLSSQTGNSNRELAGNSGKPYDSLNNYIRQIEATQVGEIFLLPELKEVKTIAYQNWSNSIAVLGVNPLNDLLKTPEMKEIHNPQDNGGSANISEYQYNKFIIKGSAPAYGSMKVQLTITRKIDKKQITTEFIVQPQQLKQPEFDRTMYPGMKYLIKPNMPFLSGQKTSAMLTDGSVPRAISQQGEEFYFTPSTNDTNKNLYLEIYINDNLYGPKYPVHISNYPEPEIIRISPSNSKEAIVQTRSLGVYKGKDNMVVSLEINGNGTWLEQHYQNSNDYQRKIFIQTFKIIRKTADKPFIFRVTAVDQRGRKSDTQNFSGE